MGRVATILARSGDLARSLHRMGARPVEELKLSMLEDTYSLTPRNHGNTDTLRINQFQAETRPALPDVDGLFPRWQPMALTRWMQTLMLTLPLAIIATLEGTYQASAKSSGLGNVRNNDYLHCTWTLIPAVAMTTIKLLLESLAFTIDLLDPYLLLNKGSASAGKTLFQDYLSEVALTRCYSSLRNKRFAVLSTSILASIGPFLTIIASSPFDGQPVAEFYSLNMTATDHLTQFEGLVFDNCSSGTEWQQAALSAANLLVQQTIPYPQGTFNNYLFPNLATFPDNSTTSDITTSFNTSSLTTQLTAYRPGMVCEAMDAPDLRYSVSNNGSSDVDDD